MKGHIHIPKLILELEEEISYKNLAGSYFKKACGVISHTMVFLLIHMQEQFIILDHN